jgi:hypothetical protein
MPDYSQWFAANPGFTMGPNGVAVSSGSASAGGGTTGTSYNTNFPQSNTAYGTVPAQIGVPPSTYSQVGSIYPNLGGQVGQMSGNIGNELAGQLSPDTIAALQQHAAQFGTQLGMPGSQFAGNAGLRSLGLNVEATKRQGGQDLLAAQTSLAGTQTNPSLAAEIAGRNATMASAPNPQMAAEQQMSDWMTKFNASLGAGRGGGGGGGGSPAGGTGTSSSPWGVSAPAFGVGGGGSGTDPMAGDISDPNSSWWDSSPGGGTFYNPATDTSNYDYGLPQAYNTAGTPDQTSVDPNSGQYSYDPYAGGDSSWY